MPCPRSDPAAVDSGGPIDLLLRRRSRSVAVIGNGCAPALRPGLLPASPKLGQVDLVVVAPDRSEERDRRWPAVAADAATSLLSSDGLAYVMAGYRARCRLERELDHRGLLVAAAFLQLPNRSSPRLLVPLQRLAIRRVIERLLPARPSRRRVAAAFLHLPGSLSLLYRYGSTIAVVFERRTTSERQSWLSEYQAAGDTTVIALGHGRPSETVVILPIEEDTQPTAVLKAALGEEAGSRLIEELAAIETLGESARSAGAAVPEASMAEVHGYRALRLAAIEGRLAAVELFAAPKRFEHVVAGIADWLERWNKETAIYEPLDRSLLDREVLDPASELAPWLPSSYRFWLAERCRALIGTVTPLVAIHNDLTMWNVLLLNSGAVGILDWETAHAGGLPLVDFHYAVVDAAAIASRRFDRPAAFASIGRVNERRSAFAAARLERFVAALNIPKPVAELAIHSCWLRHALDEQRLSPSGQGPFLRIIQLLAAGC